MPTAPSLKGRTRPPVDSHAHPPNNLRAMVNLTMLRDIARESRQRQGKEPQPKRRKP